MYSYDKIFFILLYGTLLGCSEIKEENKGVVFSGTPLQPVLPNWVTSPPNTGELVVAIVPMLENTTDIDFQMKIAVLDAQAQLARNRASYIIDETELSTKRDQNDLSSLNNFGIQRSHLSINFSSAYIVERYIAENGDLYILYGFR